MWPVFADPKTDFIFKRIFATETHKHLLVELLNALLELEGDRRIKDVTYLTADQSVPVKEMKLSVVDVKCRDERGRTYVVEMQILNVEAMEKRIVYNASKAYVMQLRNAEDYGKLCPVVGVTICDFVFWPDVYPDNNDGSTVPMLSRWRMQEQHSGSLGLSYVQYVFVELPKYTAGSTPESLVDRWAYFFREAENLTMVPSALEDAPFRAALEVARTASFSPEEWDLYDRAKMAEQDARGALTLAHRQGEAEGEEKGRAKGHEEGREQTLRQNIPDLCAALDIEWSTDRQAAIETMKLADLEALWTRLVKDRRW